MAPIIFNSTVQYSTVWYGTVQYSTVWYGTVQYSTIQYSTVWHSTVQYSTVQYGTVQYSMVQYSTVWSGMFSVCCSPQSCACQSLSRRVEAQLLEVRFFKLLWFSHLTVCETRMLSSDIRLQNLEFAPSSGSGYLHLALLRIPLIISTEYTH